MNSQAFEEWAQDEGLDVRQENVNEHAFFNGVCSERMEYVSGDTRLAWRAWQAAIEAAEAT